MENQNADIFSLQGLRDLMEKKAAQPKTELIAFYKRMLNVKHAPDRASLKSRKENNEKHRIRLQLKRDDLIAELASFGRIVISKFWVGFWPVILFLFPIIGAEGVQLTPILEARGVNIYGLAFLMACMISVLMTGLAYLIASYFFINRSLFLMTLLFGSGFVSVIISLRKSAESQDWELTGAILVILWVISILVAIRRIMHKRPHQIPKLVKRIDKS